MQKYIRKLVVLFWPIFIGYVLSMIVIPTFQLGFSWVELQKVWDRWQGFNVGALAFLTSVIALQISIYKEDKKRKFDTLGQIRSINDSDVFQKHSRIFITVINKNISGDELGKLASLTNQDNDEAQALRYMCNHYEFMAMGIKEGVFCEETYLNYYKSTIIRHFECTKPYILGVRAETGSENLFIEFEKLANKWKSSV